MHQGKIILVCALVVSVAMTANAQCVDEGECSLKSYSTADCTLLSKPEDGDRLVKEHTVWESDLEQLWHL